MKEPPTYYETIVNSKIWNEWRETQEKTLEFDIVESIECGYLSDKHWEAFIRWIESRPMQENATSMQKVKIRNKEDFEAKLHKFIYDNSNALISMEIARLVKKFIKELEECYLSIN